MRSPRHHILIVHGTWGKPGDGCNLDMLEAALDGQRDRHGREQQTKAFAGLGARRNDSRFDRLRDGAAALSIESYASTLVAMVAADWSSGDALTCIGHSRGVRVLLRMLADFRPHEIRDPEGGVLIALDGVSSERISYIPDPVIALPEWMPGVDLIALDEQRLSFAHMPLVGPPRVVERIYCRGAHADIGGTKRQVSSGLADCALILAAEALERHGLAIRLSSDLEPNPTAPITHPDYLGWWPPRRWIPGRNFLRGPERYPGQEPHSLYLP